MLEINNNISIHEHYRQIITIQKAQKMCDLHHDGGFTLSSNRKELD